MTTSQKSKRQHILDLQECCEDREYYVFSLEAWQKLPTTEAFTQWLKNDFSKWWESADDDPQLRDDSIARLFDAMREDPSLVQAIEN